MAKYTPPEKFPKSLSNILTDSVQIRGCEVFILAGVHTNTYILIPIRENISEKILKNFIDN